MTVLDVMNKRYSVRGYLEEEVEQEKLDSVLKAAQIAPTGTNAQAFKIYVINTEKHLKELYEVYSQDWFLEAPYVLAIVSKKTDAWTRKWDGKNIGDIDAAIVMTHIILEATELGLGTCFIAAFHPRPLINLLNLPEEYEPILLTPLGYPDANPRETNRKSLDELVEYI